MAEQKDGQGSLFLAAWRLAFRALVGSRARLVVAPIVTLVIAVVLFTAVALLVVPLGRLLRSLNVGSAVTVAGLGSLMILAAVVALVVCLLGAAVIAILTEQVVEGRRVSLGRALAAVGRRGLPIGAATALYFLAVSLLAVVSALVLPVALTLLPATLVATAVWFLRPRWRSRWLRRGLVAALPGGPLFYNGVRWSLCVPAAALDGLSPVEAFRESSRRAAGHWLAIAALVATPTLAVGLLVSAFNPVATALRLPLGEKGAFELALEVLVGWLPPAVLAAAYLVRGGAAGEPVPAEVPLPSRRLDAAPVTVAARAVLPRRRSLALASAVAVLLTSMAQGAFAAAPPSPAPKRAVHPAFTCSGTPVVAFNPGSPQLAGTTVAVYDQNDSPGCTYPLYQFVLTPPGGSPTVVVDYPPSPPSSATYRWNTSGLVPGTYTWTINLKDELSYGTTYDVTGSAQFVISAYHACTSIGLTQAPPSPVTPGTSVTFTATSSGCPSPVYQFALTNPAGSTSVVQAYGSASTYVLDTTGLASGNYHVQVQARNSGAPASDAYDVQKTVPIGVGFCDSAAVALTPSAASPQLAGAAITFTAAAPTCAGPTYQFSVTPPAGTAAVAQAYSATSTFAWNTAGLSPGTYTVAVDVRTSDPSVTNPVHVALQYGVDVHCTGAAVTSPLTSPQEAGTPIPLTASATGCAFPLFSFSVSGGAGSQAYGSSPSWTWPTSALAPGSYTITVDAVSAAANPAIPDAETALPYQLTPVNTAIAVTVSPSSGIAYTQPATLTATVSGDNSTIPAGGWVQFTLQGYASTTVTLSGGQASFDLSPYTASLYPGTSHTVFIYYSGSGAFGSSGTTYTFTAQPAATQTTITVSQDTTPGITQAGLVYYYVYVTVALHPGATITQTYARALQLVVDGSPVGSPQYYTGPGTVMYTSVAAATATCTAATTTGTCPHTIAVEFLGNAYYAPSASAPATENVPFAATATSISATTAYYSAQFSVFSATVSRGSPSDPYPTGTVTFYAGPTAIATAGLDQTGFARTGAVYLSATSYAVYAVYNGDSEHLGSRSPNDLTFTINPTPTSITSFTSDTTTGGAGVPVTFTVRVNTVLGTAPRDGQVQLAISNPASTTFYVFGALDGTGTATITVASFRAAPSSYSVIASFPAPGSTTDYVSGLPAGPISITAPIAPTALTISAPTIQYGDDAVIGVTVGGIGGGILTAQPVILTVNSTSYTLGVDGSGNASLTLPAPAIGTYFLQASYAGDSNYGPSTATPVRLVVTRRTPVITVSANPNPVVPTQTAVLTATVAGGLSGLPTPTGTVTFSEGATTLGSATLRAGVASISTSFATEGAHTVTVAYADDTYYAPAGATYTETAARATPQVVIDSYPTTMVTGSVSVTAAVTEPLGVTPTGTLTLLDGGTAIGTPVTLTTNIGVLVAPLAGTGDHSLTVSYSGDTLHAPATSAPFTVTVNLAASHLVMTIPPSVNFADPATIAAFVTAPGETLPPTGTINVWEGGSSCTIDASVPSGSCSLTWDTTGPVTVEADYSGDGVYAPASVTQTVNVAPGAVTITVTQPSQWAIGQPLTLGWAVTGPADGQIDVTANPGGTGCAAQPLVGSCTFTLTGSGAIDVLVVYSGDPNWAVTSVELKPLLPAVCYTLTVQVTPAGSGTAGPDLAGNCPNGAGYLAGTVVGLVATPAKGYVFDSWTGPDASGNVTMTSDVFVLVTFKPICYTLQLTPGITTTETGGFVLPETNPNCGKDPSYDAYGNCNGLYRAGTSVTVDARPGYDAYGQLAVYTIKTKTALLTSATSVGVVMDGDQYVYATFGPPCFTVTVRPPASGGTLVANASAPACNFQPGYPRGTDIALVATPNDRPYDVENQYWLQSWLTENTIDNADGSTTTSFSPESPVPLAPPAHPGGVIVRHLTLTRDIVFGAAFTHCVKLTVTTVEQGSVRADPAGNCPFGPDGWYVIGTPVTLTAAGVQTSELTRTSLLRWDGAASSPALGVQLRDGLPMSDTATLTMGQDRTVTATFWDPSQCSPLANGVQGDGSLAITPGVSHCLPGDIETGTVLSLAASGPYSGEVTGFTIQYGNDSFLANGSSAAWAKPPGSAPITITAWFCATLSVDGEVIGPSGSVVDMSGLLFNGFVNPSVAPNCPLAALAWVTQPDGRGPAFQLTPKNAPPIFTVTGIVGPGDTTPLGQATAQAAQIGFDVGVYQRTASVLLKLTCYQLSLDSYTTANPAPNCPGQPASASLYLPGTVVQLQSVDRGPRYLNEGWSGVDVAGTLDAVVQMTSNKSPRLTWQDTEDPLYVIATGTKTVLTAAGTTLLDLGLAGADGLMTALPEANRYHVVSALTALRDIWQNGLGDVGILTIVGLVDLAFKGVDYLTANYAGGSEPLLPFTAAIDFIMSPINCSENYIMSGDVNQYQDPGGSMAGCFEGRLTDGANSMNQWSSAFGWMGGSGSGPTETHGHS